MAYKVKDINLASQGEKKVKWARDHMPVLAYLKEQYSFQKPLEHYKIGGAIHVTKETAVLVETLQSLGADIAWAGCNPLSTQDDIAAYLATQDVQIYAWRNNHKEYYLCIDEVIASQPHITMDDGCDVVFRIHEKYPQVLESIIGGTEETTTGVHRIKAMAKDNKLKYPIIAVNDAETKWDFDNVYGTGQGTLDGIMRASHVLFASKKVVVAGYGHCGKGVTMRAKGLGANVIVTEVDSIQSLKAKMEGYEVMPMDEAAKVGDIFITATGCKDIITEKHFLNMKDGAILCNTGHFNTEVRVDQLDKLAKSKEEVRPDNIRYDLEDKSLYVLAEGRLVNLAAAEGHSPEVMDLSFANQILSVLRIVKNKNKFKPRVYAIPKSQDEKIASIKLKAMGVDIDTLTFEQKKYLNSYNEGT